MTRKKPKPPKPKPPKLPEPVLAKADIHVHTDQQGLIARLFGNVKTAAAVLTTLGVFVVFAYGIITNFESTAHAAETKEQAKKDREADKADVTKQVGAIKQEFETSRLYGDRRELVRDKKSLERKIQDAQTRDAMKVQQDPVSAITRKRDEQDLLEVNQQLTAIELLINTMRINSLSAGAVGKDKP